MIGKQFSKSRPIPVATPVTCRICTGRYTDWILGSFIMVEKLSNFPLKHFMSWLVFSFSDVHPKEWPKSNIKRFVSKFMKTFRTILQCYLIQINIFGQFIAIIGVRKKWLLFLFFTANLPCYCGLVNCLLSSHQLLSKLYLAITLLRPALCFLLAVEWI